MREVRIIPEKENDIVFNSIREFYDSYCEGFIYKGVSWGNNIYRYFPIEINDRIHGVRPLGKIGLEAIPINELKFYLFESKEELLDWMKGED
jgi:hypothetical protein